MMAFFTLISIWLPIHPRQTSHSYVIFAVCSLQLYLKMKLAYKPKI